MKVRQVDLAWSAGFFDGEGSITLTVREEKYMRLEVTCSQKTEVSLMLYKRFFGGAIYGYDQPGREKCFQWKIFGANAIIFLNTIQPYLVVKGDDARDVVDIWEKKDYERAIARHSSRRIAAAERKRIWQVMVDARFDASTGDE